MDRVANFFSHSCDIELEPVIERCYTDLVWAETGCLMGATEGAQDIMKRGWEGVKAIVHKIVEWFKSLPSKMANVGQRIRDFLHRTPDEVIIVDDADVTIINATDKDLDEAEEIITKATKLVAEAANLVAKAKAEAVNGEPDPDMMAQAAEMVKEAEALQREYNERMDRARAVVDSFIAMEADDGAEPQQKKGRRFNVAGIKRRMTSLIERATQGSKQAQQGTANLEAGVNAASNGDGKAQGFWSRMAKFFSVIGRILGSVPGKVSAQVNRIFKRKAKDGE